MLNVLTFAAVVTFLAIIVTNMIVYGPGGNPKESRVQVRTHDYKVTRQMRKKKIQ